MMKHSGSSFGIFKIAAAYIGTVVGAGFASGQEILRFFVAYGAFSLFGIAVSTFLFFFIGYSILMLGRSLKARSHMDIVLYANGRAFGSFFDIVTTLFLFGGLAAMIAGSGAIFSEQFGLPPLYGTLAMAFLTMLTAAAGTKGVVNAISFAVPFLMVSVSYMCIACLMQNPVTGENMQAASTFDGATPNWLLSAVNYASYNIIVSIGILAPLGAATNNKKKLLIGALLGALGLGSGMTAIHLCILSQIFDAGAMEVPMLGIAQGISPVIKPLFAIVMLFMVYSTAVSNLFALTQRISARLPKKLMVALSGCLAFFISQLGFSNMVRFLYPVAGYGGMVFVAGILYIWIKKRSAVT